MQGRDESEDQAGEERERQRKTEHVQVEIDLEDAREEIFRDLFQQVESPDGEQRSQYARDAGGQHALGEKLQNDARAGGAERGADGNLFPARGEASQQKIRHIRASDQEHTTDRGEKRKQHRSLLTDQVFMERDHAHAGFRVDLVGVGGLVTPVDDAQLLLGLFARHARFQATKDGEITGAALDDIGRQSFLLEHARQPDVGLGERKFNDGGMMPMTVNGVPFRTTAWSRMFLSPPKRLCQKAWLSTATLAPPGRSSSGLKVRPRSGWTPSARKKFSVTRMPLRFSGSPGR